MANAAPPKYLQVHVVYALPDYQCLRAVQVPEGTSALAAVALSGIADYLNTPQLLDAPLGLFGEAFGTKGLPAAADYAVQEGDRIEIYRPLLSDPKEVRRRRAARLQG